MRRYLFVFVAFLLVAVFLTACSTVEESTGQAPVLEKNKVLIEPSSLFEGDTKKLEPHLGWSTGAVKVKYQGDKKILNVSCETWEKGKLVQTFGSLGAGIEGSFDGEVSVSLKDDDGAGQNRYLATIVVSDKQGYSSSKVYVPKFNESATSSTATSPKPLSAPIEVSDEQTTAVWGLMAGEGTNISRSDESIEAMAQRVEWAFVLKLSFE